MTRHQLSTSPELNSKSDLIIRAGTVEKKAGFTLHALGVCSVGIDTSVYVLLLSKSVEVRVTRMTWSLQKWGIKFRKGWLSA